MITLTFKSTLAYAALPGFKQRLADLFTTGFQHVAYFIALVYGSMRLLPANHPYLNMSNMGKFGIRHVIAEAANNLVFKRQNIDQITIFILVLIGLALMFIQVTMLALGVVVQPVMASMPTSFSGFFVTPNPTNDMAHVLMDMVFGIPGMFDSCIAQQIPCTGADGTPVNGNTGPNAGASIFTSLGFPFPIHDAIHQLFQLYSIGLLVVATLISLYFMVTVIAETAQTGTAFGKRFNKVWAPIRFVVAFGLLVPLGHGLNASQYIVLNAAKYGSGFATNGWILFNTTLTGAGAQATAGLFANGKSNATTPNIPEIGGLLQFFYVARTCAHLEKGGNDREIKPYLVKGPIGAVNKLEITPNTSYDDLIDFLNGDSRAVIRFGEHNDKEFTTARGNVFPFCGEIMLNLTDPRPRTGTAPAETGIATMQAFYWRFIKHGWFGMFIPPSVAEDYPLNTAKRHAKFMEDTTALPPPSDIQAPLIDTFTTQLESVMATAIQQMSQSGRFAIDANLVEKGWAGAAIWYNKVAELNGAITSTVLNIPMPSKYPDIMEYVQHRKNMQNQAVSFSERFKPVLANGDPVPPKRDGKDAAFMITLWEAFDFWQSGGHASSVRSAPTGNAIIDSINAIFGTEGLFNIKNNPQSHPLAQLVGVGRSLIEASVRNIGTAMVGGAAGTLLSTFFDEFTGKLASVASKFLLTFAMVSITAGFLLFYIVPFLPFIYFFFAVGGWIKGIFEAMVGAPLWALAHLRIDGEGLAGQAAVSGYFLILEIFIRPILMLFGILASISIFSALVGVLHQIFDLVIDNLTGADYREIITTGGTMENLRSNVDMFFYTIVYTIIVYLMAMSSFKLIDLIPNNILRWIGQSVGTFNDSREDAAAAMVGKATVGAQQTSGALGSGLQALVK
ncbi:MAG: DotA/TraY family protein [Alphaproteobacteria bacterium]